MTTETELYYVCRGVMDGRPLTTHTADSQQAVQDLKQLKPMYPEAALATLLTSFDSNITGGEL